MTPIVALDLHSESALPAAAGPTIKKVKGIEPVPVVVHYHNDWVHLDMR
jgi:hypothetical protein